ncbi:MAG TPA: ribosome-binding factor A [Candidatus Saccharimonadia bacterium]|nr:ribosome-binding factor A [Candidatus Saccharimonadia bacterium]
MSQRVAKIESLIQQVVAPELVNALDRDAAAATVTRVDAAPDMRNATVWIGLLGDEAAQDALWVRIERVQSQLQAAVGKRLTTKFVPRLHLERDTGGEYAAKIDRLLRGL